MKPEFADRVIVLTERNINPVELHNTSFLDSIKELDLEADAAARRAMRGVQGGRVVGEIVKDVGMAARRFRAVGRLLRRGELKLTKLERITAQSFVRRVAA